MLKNIVEPGRPQMAIWRMGITCWIPKATNTHSEYVILFAFPLQQRLHESALILRSTYTACLVYLLLLKKLLHLIYFCESKYRFYQRENCFSKLNVSHLLTLAYNSQTAFHTVLRSNDRLQRKSKKVFLLPP